MWTLSIQSNNTTINIILTHPTLQTRCTVQNPKKAHHMHCMKLSTYTIIHTPYMHCTCTVQYGACIIVYVGAYVIFLKMHSYAPIFLTFLFFVVLFPKILATKYFWITLFFTVVLRTFWPHKSCTVFYNTTRYYKVGMIWFFFINFFDAHNSFSFR